MTREYWFECYLIAYREYQLANTDDDRHAALREMSRIERTAAELYGFDFVDELQEAKKISHARDIITPR